MHSVCVYVYIYIYIYNFKIYFYTSSKKLNKIKNKLIYKFIQNENCPF